MRTLSFYRQSVITVGGIALALFLSSPASAQITYDGALAFAGHSSTYSITTDGTMGTLTGSNIASWSVQMSTSAGVANFGSGPFSSLLFVGSALSATATDLRFNYDLAGSNYLQFNSVGDRHFLLFDTNGSSPGRDVMRFDNGPMVSSTQTGIRSIASVPGSIGAVPEPATWAMMLLGFGGIGYSMRRRRKAVGIAKLA